MGKENKKSPLEQSTDKRYNRPTYTGMGTTIQDRLIDGAYISARANAPDYSWMNVIGAGVKAFKSEMDIKQAAKKAKREGDLAEIKGITDKIYATGGSLPESYYDQAYDYTEVLREKYVAAVESGNNKEATKIKGQLNMFATSIGTVKENITETAEMWNDDMLAGGMTEEQISINKSIGENNAVMNMEDGTFSWRNVDYVEGGEGYLGKEFFTPDDLKEALPLRDDVNKEAYLESNKAVLENREKWKYGEGKDFDNKTHRDANIKLIDQSIKDVGSMQSMIWDDITGFGSFADTIEDHPEFVKYFEEDLPLFNEKDGLPNMVSIGLYDKDDNGIVGYEDFIDPVANPEYDPNGDGVVTADELSEAIENDYSLAETIKELVKPKIKNAILNPPKGQEDLTKGLLADFMTSRQQQMFYGNKNIKQYKRMVPDQLGSKVKIGTDKDNKGKLMMNDGTVITGIEDYVEKGGSISLLSKMGWSWNATSKKFEHNANWGNVTQKTKVLDN
tara:strand:- start:384 stop:1895 length:1512 start_codon:yes stop_codon:yes gene_type:complete